MVALTKKSKKILIYTLAMVMLMEMLDATVLNTALPQMANNFQVSPIDLKIILTIYFLSLGIFIPVSGWAADRFGEKNTMLFALLLFILSSVACGFATQLWMLAIFRLFQGIGGAFLMPVGRQITTRTFLGIDRVKAMANVNIIALTGLLLGPVIGGILTTYASWRWIFFINLPFGLVGSFLIYYYLPIIRPTLNKRFDLLGFILIACALGSLLFLIDILIDIRFNDVIKFALLTICGSSLLLYIRHAKRHPTPLISVELFDIPEFKLTIFGSFLSRLPTTALPFLVPLMLQGGYHFNAFHSSLLSVPIIFSTLISMFFLTYILKKYDNQKLMLINTGFLFIIFCSYSLQAIHLNLTLLIVEQIIMGFLMALQAALMNVGIYNCLPESHLTSGVTINSGIIQISGSFGISLAALTMIVVIGPNDLQHQIPLIAFKTVFLVQSIYLLIAFYLFIKYKQTHSEDKLNQNELLQNS